MENRVPSKYGKCRKQVILCMIFLKLKATWSIAKLSKNNYNYTITMTNLTF